MWPDTETDVDFLNYTEIAELIAELIERPSLLPLSLGVFGSWGVGKSSTLRLVEAELKKNSDKYLIIKFDAWLYQDFDDARAALMSVITGELVKAAPKPDLKEKAKGLFARVNKLRALGLLMEAGALTIGVPTFGLVQKGITGLGDVLTGQGNEADVSAIEDGIKAVGEKTSGLVEPAAPREPPQEIEAFREEFGEVLQSLGKIVVVFIDNLDRCLPANAIQTLEAIRLFLFLPKTAFVISADEDMIRHAVAHHFKEPGERHIADYLDKLIQVPVRVPRVGVEEVRAYLFLLLIRDAVPNEEAREKIRQHLLERLRLTWTDEQPFNVAQVLAIIDRASDDSLRTSLEMAERMAPMLAQASRVQGNPRIVKRLLNVVRMRTSIAKKRKMPLDETIIAKLALFERCTDSQATEALHDAINNSPGGKLLFLAPAEAGEEESEYKSKLPEAWQKHLLFIGEWIRLEPKISDVNLKPAVYLARETIPLRYATKNLPHKVATAIAELLKTPTLVSSVAANVIAGLDASERILVTEQVVNHARQDSEWKKARADFRGLILLARSSTDAAKIIRRFIQQLPVKPPWMATMLKSEEWFEG
ncbi:P-loop NTPase fold protein [Hyphomicrobium sp. DY-1]|uniref:KAP family P-loop NTPase fold protein n=1 Tax=Hyphomicrobium sp. DY-1 TaxID=3075650 RepID=UPI0039C098B8